MEYQLNLFESTTFDPIKEVARRASPYWTDSREKIIAEVMVSVPTEKGEPMNGLLNNALSVRTLNNLMKGLDNRICEIYNQGYREGYKDGTEVALDKIKEQIISEVFGNDELKR